MIVEGAGQHDVAEALHRFAVPRAAAHNEFHPFRAVDRGHDLGMFVEPVKLAARLRVYGHDEMDLKGIDEGAMNRLTELLQASSGPRGYRERRTVELAFPEDAGFRRDGVLREEIGFREDRQH